MRNQMVGRRATINKSVIASCSENVLLSSYASGLPAEAKLQYESILSYNKGTFFLPAPYEVLLYSSLLIC
jgi:hypothetical protein